ncbi:MAG TPA: hypothetical protein VN861_02985 [Candidatus Acidoferrales bacterium]|nr:hypothetical protein [Candidatus Acidoferrales bacterium]
MTIYKYQVEQIDDQVEIIMPVGAKVLHVAAQSGFITLWALVNPNAGTVMRRFAIVGTGHAVPGGLAYLGTAHIQPFVWHIFG